MEQLLSEGKDKALINKIKEEEWTEHYRELWYSSGRAENGKEGDKSKERPDYRERIAKALKWN
jgi:hypothetical protein